MAKFNSVDISSISKMKDELETKITNLQELGLPGIKDIPKTLWKNLIEPKLLTPRQVAKKILIIQGQGFELSEEDAQIIVYGKAYYKNGKLYDNDKKDPACVAKPGDEDYESPIDENHPMWKKVEGMFKELKDKLVQLGIKLGEFLIALPAAIISIATSLIALVSSIIILPFGSGIPTALTAVQTMVSTLKSLQSKTAELLPLLAIIDMIALLLPKEAQAVVAQINVIFAIILTIITSLLAILGLLEKVTSALGKAKKKMDEQSMELDCKVEPSNVNKGDTVKLSATATGGDWNFNYKWTDQYNNVIGNTNLVSIAVQSTTTFNCIATDGKGTIKRSSVKVKVD